MGKRVAVIGASGLVGATFVESMLGSREMEVVPVIHSSGNAWRLARHGLELRTVNLLDHDNVGSALVGCTHVVNCSRGGDDVMLAGLRNILDQTTRMRAKGFIHLSSVMVYGDPPSADTTSEDGTTPRHATGSYAGTKLQQDQMVQRAASTGLPALILCPPNITGPYSYFLGGLVAALRQGAFSLLDGGESVCNVVDVDNLAHAIELSLDHCTREAPRLFVTDDEELTWRDVLEGVMPLCWDAPAPPAIERAELLQLREAFYARSRIKVLRSLKHLVSSDVRAALRQDPLWAKIDAALRQSVAKIGGAFEERMRLGIEGPVKVVKAAPRRGINASLSIQQLRGVRHSCARAKATIGYRPRHSFPESMKAYRAWYRSHTGQNSSDWELVRHLWA